MNGNSILAAENRRDRRRSKRLKKIVEETSRVSSLDVEDVVPDLGFTDLAPPDLSSPVDLLRFFQLDVPIKEFFLPHLSFGDLVRLEQTCKTLRDLIRSRHWWRYKVADYLKGNSQARDLFARYSSKISSNNPNFHRRGVLKMLHDVGGVESNILAGSCRKSSIVFSLDKTCHKAFAVDHSGQFVFVLNGCDVEVHQLVLSKSKRGVELTRIRQLRVSQEDQFCSHLAVDADLLYHVTFQQFHAWNWRTGERLEIRSPNQKDLAGLGNVKCLVAKGGFLVVGSNDNDPDTLALLTSGATLVRFWRYDAPGDRFVRGAEWHATPVMPDPAPGEVVRVKPSSVSIDMDDRLVGVGYGFHFHSPVKVFMGEGRLCFFDPVAAEKPFVDLRFEAPVSTLRVNASRRQALVGFDKRVLRLPYVRLLDVNSGDALRDFSSVLWTPRCLWTDWTRYVFTGDVEGLLVWHLDADVTGAGDPAGVISGINGLPVTDRICQVNFDGFHLIVYTRGNAKATVRVLDFLKLSSLKF